MERSIAHIDMDTFFVSVERLVNPKLVGRPVVVGGTSDRGVVAGCSYEARSFGVHSGMPVKMARQLCSEAAYVRGDMELYSKYSDQVTEIVAEAAPLYEKASIDEHYIDITGLDHFFGCLKWSTELRQRIIRETGLPVSLGLSVNKTVSKIATGEAKPNGLRNVPTNIVQPFLNPLSIRKIPMLGPQTFKLLRSMGIITIGTLSTIPPEMMERLLGKNGISLWKKANGIDPTPVQSWSSQKSMSSERTFEQDTTDVQLLETMIIRMSEELAFELRSKQKMTSCVTVKIRYSNFDTHTLQKKIPYTSFDHIIRGVAKTLFRQLYNRRMLIRLVGVRLSNLISGTYQMNLFEDAPEMIRLYHSMDSIRQKFGKQAIHSASAL
ncbi:MAG: DNA polymerase IV [Prolixibacteraceae bacterium]|nr:DNA polymerase IV [Prolixibacteraceae bacterium]MDI9564140.1 DNA polymerase IV [Bacteroidota bacterium]NLS99105.1 DNA polymerase IV [Bacteroidales bacterium]HNZ69262.1 DNA polymerase IV [Prolixibacteraceae bacterium]HOC85518.1 DNA polymerase IV [Prolixibacteraceae bacterium]